MLLDNLPRWVLGSFRIGELLCESAETFSPASNLLGSDVIHLSPSSYALWIRDPKVSKHYGDVVGIWETPQFHDIDPFKSFSSFWAERIAKKFPLTQSLFVRKDGKIFTHRLITTTPHSLISHYSLPHIPLLPPAGAWGEQVDWPLLQKWPAQW